VQQAEKKSLAPGVCVVVIRWFQLILPWLGKNDTLWNKWSRRFLLAQVNVINSLYIGNCKESSKITSVRVIRRGFRKLFSIADRTERLMTEAVQCLTTKSTAANAQNGLVLGVIAGVSARLPHAKPFLEAMKPVYHEFYIREFINSKTVLPNHVSSSLTSYFEKFTTLDSLQQHLIPPFEKALLRAPEIVMINILSDLLHAVPKELDLSSILANQIGSALIKTSTSANLTIRNGSLRSFGAFAAKSSQDEFLSKVVELIITPLSQGKVSSADHRAIYTQLLALLKGSVSVSTAIVSGLCRVIIKESNDTALNSEIPSLFVHLAYLLQNGSSTSKEVMDLILKGLADKKPQNKKLWAMQLCETLWAMSEDQFRSAAVSNLLDATLEKLLATWLDVYNNQASAAQTGLLGVATAISAVCVDRMPQMDASKSDRIKAMRMINKLLTNDVKTSFLLNEKIYNKFTAASDLTWLLRAVQALSGHVKDLDVEVQSAWANTFIYLFTSNNIPHRVRLEATKALTNIYIRDPYTVVEIFMQSIAHSVLESSKTDVNAPPSTLERISPRLDLVVKCLTDSTVQEKHYEVNIMDKQAMSMLIYTRPETIPKTSWIESCLRIGVDPGQFAERNVDGCIQKIRDCCADSVPLKVKCLQNATYTAAADLAFVSPKILLPHVVEEICQNLDPAMLESIGATEAAIYRTPDGTAHIDVLATSKPIQPPNKNSKEYNTLKWEEELRQQLAAKKGQVKKLTKEEQGRVDKQLVKEFDIRKSVAGVVAKLEFGMGMLRALINGPPIELGTWFGKCVQRLYDVISAGAGLLVGELAASTYIECASKLSSRLGAMRPFLGVATLRASGVVGIPKDFCQEPLGQMVTRVLYRLRFMSEQRPFDVSTLSYALHLIFIVLEQGAVECTGDESDEQLTLAGEFLSFHTDVCSSADLPRARILKAVLNALQCYNQHFRLFKDCLNALCQGVSLNLDESEADVMLKAAIAPQIAVRTAALQAISSELELKQNRFCVEIWLACYDDEDENKELASEIWLENSMVIEGENLDQLLTYLGSTDVQLRRATARAIAGLTARFPERLIYLLKQLMDIYIDKAKPYDQPKDEYGMPLKVSNADPWPTRHGIALAYGELATLIQADQLSDLFEFMINNGPLADNQTSVQATMLDSATKIVATRGDLKVEELMTLFEQTLDATDASSSAKDVVNEAVIILYGALARHLSSGDARVPKVVQRLLQTLRTPSENVQHAVSQCLPPLVQKSSQEVSQYVQTMMEDLLSGKTYATRRGAAYGLGGIVKGRGLSALREFRLTSSLKGATEDKKDPNRRQGAFLAFELLSSLLGPIFEPYIVQVVPQLLVGFADTSADVRDACLDAAKACFPTLTSFGVKQVLPILLQGLDETQWRSKKGACDTLGAMAYLDPSQLALSLPDIIPPLTEVLTDSHKEVRASANRSLQRFGEVISNPEIKGQVDILLKALSDPTKYTDDALDALIKVNFTHYLDAPSLALVVRILERGLGDRSSTKRKASQIIGSLAHLTDKKDLTSHLPILVAGLRIAIVDPVPATRATASKALGSTLEKLGEDALPDLIPSLMNALKADTGAGDRLGSAQALSEVLAGLGTSRLEESLPTILQNATSSRPAVREGFMSLFIFLPATFGNSFANYLGRIIPPILSGLADDVESIRDTALRAGRLLVKNFATRAIDLLLPELERGLADDSYRIRLSSVELVGDLLFNLTGISGKNEADEIEEDSNEAGQSLLEILGEEKRNKVLSALYICRCDTSGLVKAAAINVWKALVSTPRTLRELVPTLTQLVIRRLASSNMEQKEIAGNALGELIRKAGENVLATLLPTLEEGLQTSSDVDARQGICIALRELISAASPDALDDYEKTLISVVRTALVDSDENVREAAAEAFDSLQKIFGKKAVDQVLPHLLNMLRSEDGADHALSALLTLLTEQSRANIILPNLLPTLLTQPISAFHARALASLAQVSGASLNRRLPAIINNLMDAIVACKDDDDRKTELDTSLNNVLLAVDEFDGLNTAMSIILGLVKHDDHRKRASMDRHLAKFFQSTTLDISRYHQDLIRALLVSFDDSDKLVVEAAHIGLTALTLRLKKEEMEFLVPSTRQIVLQVGIAGHPLPGFALPKGISAILPIFLQGLMNGTAEQRTQSALALSDIIDRTSPESLKPYVTQITGPLIRVVSERSVEIKSAILLTLNNLLEKIPLLLKPFLPQLQRTFAKCLADPQSELLRTRAAKALGTLITLTPRVDPLIAELVSGAKTPDVGVRNAMVKALFEVVNKAGQAMGDISKNAILSLMDSELSMGDSDGKMTITFAKLLGVLIKVLPADGATALIK